MAIEYLGLSEINGPLVVLEGVQNAAFDEIVEMTVNGSTHKIGRIIEIYGDKAIIQLTIPMTQIHFSVIWKKMGRGK